MGTSADLQRAADAITGVEGRNWRDLLMPASIGGAPFNVIAESSLKSGSRNARHEAPLRDGAEIEPMGRTPREFKITGYVVGDDYFAARDALIKALEAPGPMTFIDPWMGAVQCHVDEWEKTETWAEGRVAVFSISLVQDGGEMRAVAVEADSAVQASVIDAATAALDDAAAAIADAVELAGQPAHVLNAARDKVAGAIGLAQARIKSAASSLVAEYAALASAMSDAGAEDFNAVHGAAVQAALAELDLGALLALSADVADTESDPALDASTPSGRAVQRNDWAIDRFFQRTYAALACSSASGETFSSAEETLAMRDRLTALCRDAGLWDLAGATWMYFTRTAARLPHLAAFDVPRLTGALEIAQLRHGDGARADELCALNGWEHPGFVPPGEATALDE